MSERPRLRRLISRTKPLKRTPLRRKPRKKQPGEGKKRKGHRLEVRFDLHFPDLKGCWKLEQYLLTVGDRKGSLNVQYAKQQKLEMEDDPKATSQQRLATSPETD
jgi:hypothetical protein